MKDKSFELMTKIYSELTEFRLETNIRFDNVEKDILRIENKQDSDSKALFDGYKQTYEEVKEIKNAVKDISSSLEKQEFELKVIKGGIGRE